MLEHVYYLLPLCVHVALPLLILPSWVKDLLNAPMPIQMQQLHVWGWLLTPLIVFVLGSYCLDSKNSFCFFPGTPYFHRVLRCDMTDVKSGTGEDAGKIESRQADLELIRDWAMGLKPDECKSTHWWYADLDKDAKSAFDRCVHSTQVEQKKWYEMITALYDELTINSPDIVNSYIFDVTITQIYSMFRSLFSSTNYCMDVVSGKLLLYYILQPVFAFDLRIKQNSECRLIFTNVNCRHEWGICDWSIPQIWGAEQRQHILRATRWRALGPHSLRFSLQMHSGDGQEHDGNSSTSILFFWPNGFRHNHRLNSISTHSLFTTDNHTLSSRQFVCERLYGRCLGFWFQQRGALHQHRLQ